MTTVQTRVRQISDLEGFEIMVTKDGRPVDVTANGLLAAYGFDRKLTDAKRVSEWRQSRFEMTYPGYSCIVFNGDGSVAAAHTLLRTVRETYEK